MNTTDASGMDVLYISRTEKKKPISLEEQLMANDVFIAYGLFL